MTGFNCYPCARLYNLAHTVQNKSGNQGIQLLRETIAALNLFSDRSHTWMDRSVWRAGFAGSAIRSATAKTFWDSAEFKYGRSHDLPQPMYFYLAVVCCDVVDLMPRQILAILITRS